MSTVKPLELALKFQRETQDFFNCLEEFDFKMMHYAMDSVEDFPGIQQMKCMFLGGMQYQQWKDER